MSRHVLDKKQFEARQDYYFETKTPYVLELQGNSRALKVGNIVWYCYSPKGKVKNGKKPDKLPANEIGFISVVKRHIKDNGLHLSIAPTYENESDIKFIDVNKNLGAGEFFDNCYCIDINSAYWDSARHFGYINDALHTEGLKKDKRVRLACLGTFAKTVDILVFDGTEEKVMPPILPEAPEVFYNPANRIYQCMDDCKKAMKEDFLFYWTDCVYVKTKEAVNACKKIMKEHGFNSKIDFVERVICTTGCIEVLGKDSGGVVKNKKYSIGIK